MSIDVAPQSLSIPPAQLRPIKNQQNIRVKSRSIAGRVDDFSKTLGRETTGGTPSGASASVFQRRKGSNFNETARNGTSHYGGMITQIESQDASVTLLGALPTPTPRYNKPRIDNNQSFVQVLDSSERFTETADHHAVRAKGHRLLRKNNAQTPQTMNLTGTKFFKSKSPFGKKDNIVPPIEDGQSFYKKR